MPMITLIAGVLLILLGVVGYFAGGMASWTALIPALFGLPIAILGVVARKPNWRSGGVIAAGVLAVLGLLGSIRGVATLFTLLGGGEVERPGAAWSQSLMALVCLAFVVLVIRWLATARRAESPPPAAQEPPAT